MKKQYQAGSILVVCFWCLFMAAGCSYQGKEEVPKETRKEIQEEISQKGTADTNEVPQEQFAGMRTREKTEQVQSISDGNYAYECLGEEGKKVYDQMLEAILTYQEKINLVTTDTELMREAYQALNCDYGGLFWVEGYVFTSYTQGDKQIGLEFSPSYVMEEEEKNRLQKQIDAVVEEWLGGISIQDSDYEKAKYVFETLIEKVDYVEGTKDNQNILSVFLHRQTVCQGYACATQYLLHQLGISSAIISGTANNQAHAWNLVELDGKYYHMDTTWGNSAYLDTEQIKAKFVNYNFFCMTDKEVSRTHQVETTFPLPECNSAEHNYYRKEGRYFESWDPEAIGAVFQEAWEKQEDSVSVKCADDRLYGQLKDYFIHQQKISDYCNGIEYVYYMESPEFCVFTVNFNE